MELGRRQFLVGAGALAALPALGGLAACRPAPGGRRVLSPSDVTYRGSFRLPGTVAGSDGTFGTTLAFRRAAGQRRVLSATVYGQQFFEVAVPSFGAAEPYPEAPLVRVWGDVTGGRRPLDGPPGRGSDVYGIYWDEPTQRLLWSYGDGYNTVSGADPSLGASVLDEATGVATPIGNWRFDRSCKMTMGGVCAVPDWFAAAHCPGQRLAAGFGGYFSIVAVGPASMGPAVAAFDPAAIAPIPGVGSITARPLVGYPFNATPYTTPDRCHRDTDYTNEFDSWNPRGGVGYWSWTDQMAQGGVWVDTPAVTGMLFCPNLGNGRTWYETSTLHAERASHAWMVYDPGDLAAVAAGTTPQWAIQPARSWSVRYPGLTYPQPGWSDGPQHPVTGVCFDTVEHMVYVAVQWPWSPGAPASGTLVSSYEIAVV